MYIARRGFSNRIWISQNEPLAWRFATTNAGGSHLADYLTGEQLMEAVKEIPVMVKEGRNIPFVVLDVRQNHERQIQDMISEWRHDDQAFKIPRVNQPYEEIVMGQWNKAAFFREQWIVIACQRGLRAGQAMRYLKNEGFNCKVLLGGVDKLPSELIL